MSSISKPFMQLFMALALALGLGVASTQPAEARDGRGLAAGIVLGAIGAAIISNEIRRNRRHRRHHRRNRHRQHRVRCYSGRQQCGWVGNRECWYNRYDERVCSGGRYKCWRERICR